mmetsp:Transcript_24741/g.62317  ORF Transcript_24741/g.62317 Transcript_24741/m.62317 type:complete len:223 (-) Transcript_24741:67-735(-)
MNVRTPMQKQLLCSGWCSSQCSRASSLSVSCFSVRLSFFRAAQLAESMSPCCVRPMLSASVDVMNALPSSASSSRASWSTTALKNSSCGCEKPDGWCCRLLDASSMTLFTKPTHLPPSNMLLIVRISKWAKSSCWLTSPTKDKYSLSELRRVRLLNRTRASSSFMQPLAMTAWMNACRRIWSSFAVIAPASSAARPNSAPAGRCRRSGGGWRSGCGRHRRVS